MQLPRTLTLDSAAAALQALSPSAAAGAGPLLVDASPLQEFDSAALAWLLQARRIAHAADRRFELRGASPALLQLAQLYGVEELLGLSADGAGA